MASSTYKVYALASTNSTSDLTGQLNEKTLFVEKDYTKSLGSLMENGRDSAYAETRLTMVTDGGSEHTCRETMISSLMYMQRAIYAAFGYYNYPYRYDVVEYLYESGKRLTVEEMESIVAFMNSLNKTLPYPIYTHIVENFRGSSHKSLLFYFPHDIHNLYTLSFLLYIFRNKGIMTALYPLMNPTKSFKSNMHTISTEFARNPGWSTGEANPTGNLSLFAYILARGSRCLTESDGPVSAAARYHDITILRDFIVDVVGLDDIMEMVFSEALQPNIGMLVYLLGKGDK